MCIWAIKLFFFFSVLQRPVPEQKELTNKWNEMGTDEPGNADTNNLTCSRLHLDVCVCSYIAECLHPGVWLTHRSPEQDNSSITMLSVCSVYDNIHRFLHDTGINRPSCETRACPDAWTTSHLLKLLLSFFLAIFLLLACTLFLLFLYCITISA